MKSKKQQIDRRQFIKGAAVSATALSFPMIVSNDIFGANAQNSTRYKCLFNHELLIIIHQKENNTPYIQSFIEKLEYTDVDAVMCCPTAWRGNLFPSEVDPTWKKYSPDRFPENKFPSYNYIMRYLQSGGDPVKDTLEACRKYGKDCFISYRMNDHHHLDDIDWPTHTDFWREHPEYWLGNLDNAPGSHSDQKRYFNYMLQPVQDHYFSILQELCTNYDVDGIELDFQRSPRYFYDAEISKGMPVMTAFIKKIRDMIDRIGRERHKSLKLCIRVPWTVDKCLQVGLDVPTWDESGLIDMINVSSYFINSLEVGIEDFKAHTNRSKIYGEMHFIKASDIRKPQVYRRFTSMEDYRGTALNFIFRGVDGLSLFNFDYVLDPNDQPQVYNHTDAEKMRLEITGCLKKITDVEYLKNVSKAYVVSPGFGSFPAKDEKTLHLVIPDDTAKIKFKQAVLRIETKQICEHLLINTWMNGIQLKPYQPEDTELFPPLWRNMNYPPRERLKFYMVPLDKIICGRNEIVIKNMENEKGSCVLTSMEIGLYR